MAKMSKQVADALAVLHQLIGEAIGADAGPEEPKEEAKAEKQKRKSGKTGGKTGGKAKTEKAQAKEEAEPLTKKQQKVADYLEGLELDAKTLREICEYLDMEDVTPRQRAATSADWLARNRTIKQIKEAIEE